MPGPSAVQQPGPDDCTSRPVDARGRAGTVLVMDTPPRVLVLNASSEPLHLIGLSRAVALVVGERAVIVSHDGQLRSERRTVPRPTVIKLSRYVHVPWRAAPLTLRSLKLRDGGVCQWCRETAGVTIDHVIPRSRGGLHHWRNVVLACHACNNRKADRLPSELGWALRCELYEPTRRDIVRLDPRVISHADALTA